jgi:16S rRNA (uracil1498-N3)-methyltransferase
MIELYDGRGKIYTAELLTLSRSGASVRILSAAEDKEDDDPALHLVQGILKGKKMDFLVQKATELGVHTFQPLLSRYCENRGRNSRQFERWQRIMLEACKQCGRPRPMVIAPTTELDQLPTVPGAKKIVLWEDEKDNPLRGSLVAGREQVLLLVGPEGGLHPGEIASLRRLGYEAVTLGRRTLRAETAALAAVAITQHLLSFPGTDAEPGK